MIEIEARARKWGNSIGVILPKDVVEREGIKEDDTVRLLVVKPRNILKALAGTIKSDKPTQQIKDELRKELYDD